jgi:hypothetical protein
VKPGVTAYIPTGFIRLKNVVLSNPNPNMEASGTSLRISTRDAQVVICTLSPEVNTFRNFLDFLHRLADTLCCRGPSVHEGNRVDF